MHSSLGGHLVSPMPKTRIPAIRRLWQLILTIDSLDILFAAATSHPATWASRTATCPATGPRQAVLASSRREVARHVTCLARARHAAAQTPDPILMAGAAVARDHQFPRYGYSALMESLADPGVRHPRSKRQSPWRVTNNPCACPMRSTAGRRFPGSPKNFCSGHRHSPAEMLSGN
jgi:hypothetical protein